MRALRDEWLQEGREITVIAEVFIRATHIMEMSLVEIRILSRLGYLKGAGYELEKWVHSEVKYT